ncbi:ImmA/IrrE family metallo-endopeptidase [Cohnella sp. CFH 77786]|uniref:ImmA/IrrE family metallo-endopeptidase n=1 Tax=Cohnella sp. CFH 77786 TaxID=2662265 RepID=UPI001C6111E8|nr:ImmA/IrrE family metallo-endopeptidase [Cohnella sp. CFH 77786]MBW5447453.1 ImmA/IrrE family metallo-endopeptidase [Cohnella sp. CFH 77786]
MNRYYWPTPFEQWTEQLWSKAGIRSAQQLNIDEVASRLNVWVHYMDETSRALEYLGMRSILVDKRLGRREQWEEFLHELCHVLRHAGNQTLMPKSFCESQEAEANRFVLYAAMPASMIRDLKLPDHLDEAVEALAERFGVTPALASRRLEQIQRRIFSRILWEEAIKHEGFRSLPSAQRKSPPHGRALEPFTVSV